jgi:AraC family transcriptional regulator
MSQGAFEDIDWSAADAPATLEHIVQQSPSFSYRAPDLKGLYLASVSLPAYASPEASSLQHGLVLFMRSLMPVPVRRCLAGVVRNEMVRSGDVIVIPAGVTHQAEWTTPGEVLMLALEPTLFERESGRVDLLPCFSRADATMQAVGLALRDELASGGLGGRLYAESAVQFLVAHLLRHYNARPLLSRTEAKVSTHRIQEAIDFLHAHLEHNVSLAELAALLGLSPHQIGRQFKRATGLSPHGYLLRLRVHRAWELLERTSVPIAQIALQVGFANQGHLGYHFKRLTGTTPAEVRHRGR